MRRAVVGSAVGRWLLAENAGLNGIWAVHARALDEFLSWAAAGHRGLVRGCRTTPEVQEFLDYWIPRCWLGRGSRLAVLKLPALLLDKLRQGQPARGRDGFKITQALRVDAQQRTDDLFWGLRSEARPSGFTARNVLATNQLGNCDCAVRQKSRWQARPSTGLGAFQVLGFALASCRYAAANALGCG